MKLYEYTVEGHGQFPLDMLRYDCAWPAFESEVHDIGRDRSNRIIRIRSNKKPTDERWESFGWKVINWRLMS